MTGTQPSRPFMGADMGHRDCWDVVTHGEEETRQLGALLGRLLQPGDVVAIEGPLGVGKTRLVQGIAAGMGITRPVTSPTFILMNVHRAADGRRLHHFDCYRLTAPEEEAYALGWDQEFGGDAVCVVEWADRVASLLPPDHLRVVLEVVGDETRRLRFCAKGSRSRTLLEALQRAWEKEQLHRPEKARTPCG